MTLSVVGMLNYMGQQDNSAAGACFNGERTDAKIEDRNIDLSVDYLATMVKDDFSVANDGSYEEVSEDHQALAAIQSWDSEI